jgi:maltooligosyltrehalose trehalohydrolase
MKHKTLFPKFLDTNTYEFNLWAPKATEVKIVAGPPQHEVPMTQLGFGYWSAVVEGVKPGMRYRYQIDGGESFPDPASLSQPEGVHGASEVIDLHDFQWTDAGWQNIPLNEMVQYELHTGTFSPEGTFAGIRSRLVYLLDLGINTIEILPVAQFSGERNWGYDGVYPFAVQNSYGGAKGLMELVDACHQKGIAVILDVVYNHFGPEGNYVGQFGHYFSGKYSTPWGEPVNFDGAHSDGVRQYVVQNALMWCRDFHMDGLRLDAVHSIFDFSATHILQAMAENLHELSVATGKKYYLIAESHLNDVRYISPLSKGGYGLDAQWSDDFHHAVHVLATGERKGYYEDFGEPSQLSKAIKKAFVYDGQYSAFRKKSYGNSTENNGGEQFVIFNQNHDQVGNRKNGERLISLAGFEMAKLIAGSMFVAPNVPMLFMGEEYGERNPFYYFVSHLDPKLNRLVSEGRKKEFEKFYDDDDNVPDPASPETFEKSKLSWAIRDNPEYQAMFNYYKMLINLRKNHPVLKVTDKDQLKITEEGKVFMLQRWQGSQFVLAIMNYEKHDVPVTIPSEVPGKLQKLIASSATQWNGPGEKGPSEVSAGSQLTITKESILIYST